MCRESGRGVTAKAVPHGCAEIARHWGDAHLGVLLRTLRERDAWDGLPAELSVYLDELRGPYSRQPPFTTRR